NTPGRRETAIHRNVPQTAVTLSSWAPRRLSPPREAAFLYTRRVVVCSLSHRLLLSSRYSRVRYPKSRFADHPFEIALHTALLGPWVPIPFGYPTDTSLDSGTKYLPVPVRMGQTFVLQTVV